MLVRRPQGTSLDFAEPPGGRSISVDIGPFEDQADLIHFAMLLETARDVGHIDLIEAEPENALFIVRAESAGAVASLLNRLPDYTITSTAFGNMVAAKIEDRRRAAAILLAPSAAVAGAAAAAATVGTYTEPVYLATATGPGWWRRALLAVAMGASAAGLFFIALNGVPSWPGNSGQTARPSATVAVSVPTRFVPPSQTPTPTPVLVAPATPTATAPPSPSPSAVPTASATPSPTPTPVPAVTSRHFASFSTSLGTIRALNACVWDTPIDGALVLSLTRDADGAVSGGATVEGLLTYQVTETPPTATCRSSEVDLTANGWASGGSAVSASMTGARDLVATFEGTMQGNTVVGDLTIRRDLSTTSTFGDTNETRTAVIRGLTLVRTN